MKKLDAYVFRELVTPFLIGTLAVVLMFQANFLIFQLKTFSVAHVPFTATLQVMLYLTPGFLRMTLPVGMSLAASLAISRLARESELTAMRAAGAAILRVCLPIAIFGVFVGIGNFLLSEKVMPKAEMEARKMMQQFGVLGLLPDFKNNITVNLSKYSANIGSVTKGPNESLQLTDILLYERPDADTITFIRSKYGEYKDGVWKLHLCDFWYFRGMDLTQAVPGKDVVINDRVSITDFFSTPLDNEMSAEQLKEAVQQRRKVGVDATQAEILYHSRFAIPFSALVFAFASPVFAVIFARSGGFMGILLSIILVFLYYNGYIIMTDIVGRSGWLSPFWAAWLTNFVFLGLALLAVRRLE